MSVQVSNISARKFIFFTYFYVKTLKELLMSTHNICFLREIRKNILPDTPHPSLSRAMILHIHTVLSGPFQSMDTFYSILTVFTRLLEIHKHIDHEIFSTVILSLPLIQKGQLSVSGERMCAILVNRLED